MEPWWANLYRLYYRCYYYGYAKRVLLNPQTIHLKSGVSYPVRSELDPQAKKHASFLYVQCPKKVGAPNRWRFWRRKFAFSNNGGRVWWQLPSMTPWEWTFQDHHWEIKYGLNQLFVQKHRHDLSHLTFAVWD